MRSRAIGLLALRCCRDVLRTLDTSRRERRTRGSAWESLGWLCTWSWRCTESLSISARSANLRLNWGVNTAGLSVAILSTWITSREDSCIVIAATKSGTSVSRFSLLHSLQDPPEACVAAGELTLATSQSVELNWVSGFLLNKLTHGYLTAAQPVLGQDPSKLSVFKLVS